VTYWSLHGGWNDGLGTGSHVQEVIVEARQGRSGRSVTTSKPEFEESFG
jgi:hypothetical protein